MTPHELPTVGRADAPGSAQPSPAATPPPPPTRPRASSARLVSTLGLAGAVAGLAIVLVHQWSQPRIEAYQAMVLREAVIEVIVGSNHSRTFFFVEGAYTDAPPSEADTASADRLYVGYDAAGIPLGVALAAGKPGYQDVIRLIFGFDPATAQVLGMKVLDSRETPGLGDKIEKDTAWVASFRGALAPLEPVKEGAGRGGASEVDMITGATISTRAVIEIINERLDAVGGGVQQLWDAGIPASPPPSPPGPSPSASGETSAGTADPRSPNPDAAAGPAGAPDAASPGGSP